jgi:DNA gyrase subunit A
MMESRSMPENIQTISIARETHERYLRYALSVITSRALPDVRDGLKPVQRRILYTMYHDLRLHFDGRPAKCMKISGAVIGNYHPHGDQAAYEALARMAQDWVMFLPLVHGQGNFGSVDGDPPAAARYTEAKLSAVSDALLAELRQDTVDMRPNYDSTTTEPVVLPAQFPNLLVNGSSGIAVGMATNIPPHNLGEVLRSCVALIDEPDITTARLMDKGVKGPDFPLGGKIVSDRTTIRRIYEEGQGSVKVQGEWKVDNSDPKRPQIIITSIPYNVDKAKLENDIGVIIEGKLVPQLTGLTNETNEEDGLRIALDIKPGTEPALVMAYLYKHTSLQQNFAYNMTCLVPVGEAVKPEQLGLKGILQCFLDFRLATVRRRFEFDLAQLKRRIHLLDGFRIIFDALDKAIKMIRESDGKQDAATKLMSYFELDEEQTTAILDAQLYKIAQMEIQKVLDELRDKKREAKRIQEILGSEAKLWDVIRQEFKEIEEKYAEKRSTRIASDEELLEFDEEKYIVKENTNVVLTRDGWIKRVGRLASVEGTRVREGDAVIAVVPGSTLDNVAFFADDGTAYTMRINEVPSSSGYGEPIAKFFKLDDQVKIIAAETADARFIPAETKAPTKEDPSGPYLLVATSEGLTLRVPFAPYRVESTKAGRRFVRLDKGARVVLAKVLADEESLFLASKNGHVVHFLIEQINIVAGVGKGVIGIKLDDDDSCLGGALVSNRHDALMVETTGGGTKEFRRGAYPCVNRGGRGHEVIKRGGLVRVLPPPIDLIDWEALEETGTVKTKGNGKPAQRNGDGTLFE